MRVLAGLLLALVTAVPAAAAPRSFAIDRFAVSLQVNADGTLIVREDISVEFTGAHNGLIRVVPVRYERGGLDWSLRVDGVGAYGEDGGRLRAEVTRAQRALRIKAWVPGAVDARRTVTFVYRVRRGYLGFEDHDELYWNATGDEWDVPIRRAEVFVNLPDGVARDAVRTVAYTGARGMAGRDYTQEWIGEYLAIATTRPLAPREGLTVVVGWPPGRVARATALQEAGWFLGDNWPLGLPGLTLVLAGLMWWAYGRDPAASRSIAVEYEPPPGLRPAQAGALVDERAEPRDVIATLIDLAVRGYLKIESIRTAFDEPDFMFRRLKPVLRDPDLAPLELFILAKLFGDDWGLNLRLLSEVRRDYDNVFPPVRDQIYRSMIAAGLIPRSPYRVRVGWALVAGACTATGIALALSTPRWVEDYGWALPIGLAASGFVVLAFAPIMPRKTWRGVRMALRIRGFQEFLERAEKDRLERMPSDTLHRWLPWAIALGVTERWVEHFHGLKVDDPSWFSGPEPFSLGRYGRDLASFQHETRDALLTTRRGSDGGGDAGGGGSGFGGGSSGGGFGGGGGTTF